MKLKCLKDSGRGGRKHHTEEQDVDRQTKAGSPVPFCILQTA